MVRQDKGLSAMQSAMSTNPPRRVSREEYVQTLQEQTPDQYLPRTEKELTNRANGEGTRVHVDFRV